MKILITLDDIKEIRPMSATIPFERILPYIQETQQFDLRMLLGDPFYTDFMLRFDNSLDAQYSVYQKLLKGETYTLNANQVEFTGLIPYIVYLSLARFFNNNQVNVSRFGIVQKNAEQSTALDWRQIAAAVAELRSNALNLQVGIRQYLMAPANVANFPLFVYQDGSALQQTGVKFFNPDDSFPINNNYNGRTLISW